MKVIELVQKLQALKQPNLEIVAHYPEFDYPFSVDEVELTNFKSPDEPTTTCITIRLGDEA